MVTTTRQAPPADAHIAPVAGEIAAQLGETKIEARQQIVRARRVMGEERTRARSSPRPSTSRPRAG